MNKTKLYTVLLKRNSPEPLNDVVIVPNKFNFWAFLFSPIWALYNKLWFLFVGLVGLEVISYIAPNYFLIEIHLRMRTPI